MPLIVFALPAAIIDEAHQLQQLSSLSALLSALFSASLCPSLPAYMLTIFNYEAEQVQPQQQQQQRLYNCRHNLLAFFLAFFCCRCCCCCTKLCGPWKTSQLAAVIVVVLVIILFAFPTHTQRHIYPDILYTYAMFFFHIYFCIFIVQLCHIYRAIAPCNISCTTICAVPGGCVPSPR